MSLFEPHTEAICKGKAAKPTEFGKLVKLQEAENQIVVDYQVYEQRPEDRTLLVPSVEAHRRVFGGIQRWVGWGVVTNNLWVLMTAENRRPKSLAKLGPSQNYVQ